MPPPAAPAPEAVLEPAARLDHGRDRRAAISGELGEPKDVVPVVRFLAAPETSWVTAQTIYVNGGMISPVN